MTTLNVAVEGKLDLAVLQRVLAEFDIALSAYYGLKGKDALRRSLSGYNNAARWSPWVVLIDLDHDAECAPEYCAGLLAEPSPLMCLQGAVREVESWLLADSRRLASYLAVPESRMPQEPEIVPNPKRAVVDLARHSRKRLIRENLVPRPGGGREVGPLYETIMQQFARTYWVPAHAEERSPSLQRFRRKLSLLRGAEA